MERQEKYRMSNKRVKIGEIALQLSRYLAKVIGNRTRHKTDKSTTSIRSFSFMPELYVKKLVKKKGEKRTDKEYDRLWIYL